MPAGHVLTPEAVRNTRHVVSHAVQNRTPESPVFPNRADFATEDEFCEALLDTLFGPAN